LVKVAIECLEEMRIARWGRIVRACIRIRNMLKKGTKVVVREEAKAV